MSSAKIANFCRLPCRQSKSRWHKSLAATQTTTLLDHQSSTHTGHHHVIRRSFYSVKKGIDRTWLARFQQPIDLSPDAIARWSKQKKLDSLRHEQRYQEMRHKMLGPDLATAHFIVGRGGKVKFEGDDRWYKMESDKKILLPSIYVPGFNLEAIDASSTLLLYEGLDNLVDLDCLKYLDVSYCALFDDFCVNKLQSLQDSLLYLDVSGCQRVTVKGLSTLHHLKNLKRLKVQDMKGVTNMPLVTLLLEEMLPECYVDGVHFSDADALIESVDKEFSEMDNAADNAAVERSESETNART